MQRLILICVAGLLALIHAPVALAQGLDCATAAASNIDSGARAAIAAHIDQHRPGLSGDDLAIKAARSAILRPLQCNEVSLQFRVEYAKALLPVIDPLTQDTRDQVAANALRIAGELATTNALPLIARGLKDQRSAVRYAACYGAGRVFDALRMPDTVSAAAVGAADVDALLADLAALFASEKDPAVLDGCALAFAGATTVAAGKIKSYDARSQAVVTFCNAAGARAKSLKGSSADAPQLPVMLRAATSVRNALITAGGSGQTLTNPALVAAGGLSGDMLALVARALKGSDKDKLDRATLEGLVRAAEAAGSLSRQLLRVSGPPANLGEAVKSGRDDQFLRDVLAIIGDGGVLTKSPFDFPRDRFAF
ncbi:MAG: hypothetical protein KIT68_10190 [Phycisphaeraceae bacterium]|nr:hypothetical protein [Phycisphaeraceae bacterium]